MITKYKKSLEPLISIIAGPFLSWNPSVLTALSFISSLLFFIGIVTHFYLLSVISIFGFVFDVLDGYVARTQKKTSLSGAFLDSTLDRASDFLLISSFGFAHLVSWEIVILVLFSSFLISYMQARAEAVFKTNLKLGGLMQRSERIAAILIGLFLFLIFKNTQTVSIIFLIIFLLNCVTILQRFWKIKKLSKVSYYVV